MNEILIVFGIILFIGLVVVHEWGHFVAARRGGVEVEEFGIGFPPTIWARQIKTAKSKFEFTINLLPLGGFVRLKGENDADKRPGSFGTAKMSTKIKIMLAGVAANLVTAFLLLTFLALIGMPKIVDHQFSVPSDTETVREVENADVVKTAEVVKDSPAEKAGIQKDDRILRIGQTPISNVEQVAEVTKKNAGQTIEVLIERNGEEKKLTATLNNENTGNGYLGVSSSSGRSGIEVRRSTWSAPIVAGGVIGQFTELTYKALGTAISSLFKGDTAKASEQVAGPVGIYYILQEGSKIGFSFVLMIIAVISLTLALINILPIPALDGGRLFVTLMFRTLKIPLTKTREEWIHGTGFALLMVLFVLITVVDIKRFF
jgi:regulator of sigma E protease